MAVSVGHPRGTHSRYVIGCCLIPLGIFVLNNNLRRITYGIGCVWGMPSLSPLSSLGGTQGWCFLSNVCIYYAILNNLARVIYVICANGNHVHYPGSVNKLIYLCRKHGYYWVTGFIAELMILIDTPFSVNMPLKSSWNVVERHNWIKTRPGNICACCL